MEIETSPPRNPEPNGTAERYGGYITQTVRVMVTDAGLPEELWALCMRFSDLYHQSTCQTRYGDVTTGNVASRDEDRQTNLTGPHTHMGIQSIPQYSEIGSCLSKKDGAMRIDRSFIWI
jgi:hypothetical protein